VCRDPRYVDCSVEPQIETSDLEMFETPAGGCSYADQAEKGDNRLIVVTIARQFIVARIVLILHQHDSDSLT